MDHVATVLNHKSVTCSYVLSCFYFALGPRLAGRSAQTYQKCSILGIFSSLGLFLQNFPKVMKWLMTELHEKKGM